MFTFRPCKINKNVVKIQIYLYLKIKKGNFTSPLYENHSYSLILLTRFSTKTGDCNAEVGGLAGGRQLFFRMITFEFALTD